MSRMPASKSTANKSVFLSLKRSDQLGSDHSRTFAGASNVAGLEVAAATAVVVVVTAGFVAGSSIAGDASGSEAFAITGRAAAGDAFDATGVSTLGEALATTAFDAGGDPVAFDVVASIPGMIGFNCAA